MHSVPSPSASKPQISDYTRIRARSIRFLILLAAVLALYALSWRLSVAWYGKAEQ